MKKNVVRGKANRRRITFIVFAVHRHRSNDGLNVGKNENVLISFLKVIYSHLTNKIYKIYIYRKIVQIFIEKYLKKNKLLYIEKIDTYIYIYNCNNIKCFIYIYI